jgi:hypothetical protein
VLAEAEPEQERRVRPQLQEVALVVVSVLEWVVVERFRHDRAHPVAGDVGGQGRDVGAHLGVGGTEIGEVGIAERVALDAVRMAPTECVVV